MVSNEKCVAARYVAGTWVMATWAFTSLTAPTDGLANHAEPWRMPLASLLNCTWKTATPQSLNVSHLKKLSS